MPLHEARSFLDTWSSRKVQANLDICTIRPATSGTRHPTTSQEAVHPAASPLYAAPIAAAEGDDPGLGQWVWGPEMKDAMKPVWSWMVHNLVLPASRLDDVIELDSLLGLNSRLPAAHSSENPERSSQSSDESQYRCDDCDCHGDRGLLRGAVQRTVLRPFHGGLVQLQWTSPGALMPLKYETFGRIVVQVGGRHGNSE